MPTLRDILSMHVVAILDTADKPKSHSDAAMDDFVSTVTQLLADSYERGVVKGHQDSVNEPVRDGGTFS